jgi:hypothetical protein
VQAFKKEILISLTGLLIKENRPFGVFKEREG